MEKTHVEFKKSLFHWYQKPTFIIIEGILIITGVAITFFVTNRRPDIRLPLSWIFESLAFLLGLGIGLIPIKRAIRYVDAKRRGKPIPKEEKPFVLFYSLLYWLVLILAVTSMIASFRERWLFTFLVPALLGIFFCGHVLTGCLLPVYLWYRSLPE